MHKVLCRQGGRSARAAGGWFNATKRHALPRGPPSSCCMGMFRTDAGNASVGVLGFPGGFIFKWGDRGTSGMLKDTGRDSKPRNQPPFLWFFCFLFFLPGSQPQSQRTSWKGQGYFLPNLTGGGWGHAWGKKQLRTLVIRLQRPEEAPPSSWFSCGH